MAIEAGITIETKHKKVRKLDIGTPKIINGIILYNQSKIKEFIFFVMSESGSYIFLHSGIVAINKLP